MMSPCLNGLRPTSSGRTSIVPSPRPVEITGRPPRRSRAGTMLARSLTSSTRLANAPASITRPISPSAARTGMPTCDAVAGADREDGEAARAFERGADHAPGGDRLAGRARASCSARLELLVFLEDRLGLDHPPQHRAALALQLGILVGGVPIIAGAADQPGDGGRRLR